MASVELPDSRCLECHDEKIDPGIKGFDHEEHRSGRACKTCHYTAGHDVDAAALQAAGILNADVQASTAAGKMITLGRGVTLEGHVEVVCSQCHDMRASTCVACHEPPPDHSQRPCTTCHAPRTPGPSFIPTHLPRACSAMTGRRDTIKGRVRRATPSASPGRSCTRPQLTARRATRLRAITTRVPARRATRPARPSKTRSSSTRAGCFLRRLPFAPFGTPQRTVLGLPQSWYDVGVRPPRLEELHRLSLSAIGALERAVLELPQGGRPLGVRPPRLEELRRLSQAARESLRVVVRELSFRGQAVVVSRVQTPGNPRRRARLHGLRVREVPSERLRVLHVYRVPRRRSSRRGLRPDCR